MEAYSPDSSPGDFPLQGLLNKPRLLYEEHVRVVGWDPIACLVHMLEHALVFERHSVIGVSEGIADLPDEMQVFNQRRLYQVEGLRDIETVGMGDDGCRKVEEVLPHVGIKVRHFGKEDLTEKVLYPRALDQNEGDVPIGAERIEGAGEFGGTIHSKTP